MSTVVRLSLIATIPTLAAFAPPAAGPIRLHASSDAAARAQALAERQAGGGPAFDFWGAVPARLAARNDRLGGTVTLDDLTDAVRVRLDDGPDFTLGWRRLGRPERMQPVGRVVDVRTDGHQADLVHADLPWARHWLLNGPAGLEEGFDLDRRPAGEGPLVLELVVEGDVVASPHARGAELRHAPSGAHMLYADLMAFDARGRTLPSRMLVEGDTITLLVDDADARYPIRIDPIRPNAANNAQPWGVIDGPPQMLFFGLSSDLHDRRVVWGEFNHDSDRGRVRVLDFPAGGPGTLVAGPEGNASGDRFGLRVAISESYLAVLEATALRFYRDAGGSYVSDGQVAVRTNGPLAIHGDRVVVWDDRANALLTFRRDGPSMWNEVGRIPLGPTAAITDLDVCSNDTGVYSVFTGAAARVVYALPIAATSLSDGQALVEGPRGTADQRYGTSVACDGDTIAVGAPTTSSNQTSRLYVFERDFGAATFSLNRILSSDRKGMGWGVDVLRDTIVASVTGDDSLPNNLEPPGALSFERQASGRFAEFQFHSYGQGAGFAGNKVALGRGGLLIADTMSALPGGKLLYWWTEVGRGGSCEIDLECTSNQCVEGVCCESACGPDACLACTSARTGMPNGVCAPTPAGSVCGDAGDGVCDLRDTCDGNGTCIDRRAPDGQSCDLDSLACNGTATCASGVCQDVAAPDCPDVDACTVSSCEEPAGMCATTRLEGCCLADAECDDGDACTTDACVDNACVVEPIPGCGDNRCFCNTTLGCDSDCACDPQCLCLCDVSNGCDDGCGQCDPECDGVTPTPAPEPESCQTAPAPSLVSLLLVVVALLLARRRRAH